MNDQASATDLFSQCVSSSNDILKESGSKAETFVVATDSQTSEQCYGLRIAATTKTCPGRNVRNGDTCHAPRIKRHDCFGPDRSDDKDSSGSYVRRLPCILTEPIGLLFGSTLEAFELMVIIQEDGTVKVPSHSSTKGDGRSMSRRRPGRSRPRRRLICSQASVARGSSVNSDRSARTRRAATVRLEITNSVRSIPCSATARSINARSSGVVRTSSLWLRERVTDMPTSKHVVRPLYGNVERSQPVRPCRSSVGRTTPLTESQPGNVSVGRSFPQPCPAKLEGVPSPAHAYEPSHRGRHPRARGVSSRVLPFRTSEAG